MVYRCLPDQQWTMLYASAGTLALTGYTPDELVNNRASTFEDLIHPSDRSYVRMTIERAMQAGAEYSLQYRLRTKDGAEKWVREQGAGLAGEQGKITTLQGFIQDITAQQESLTAARNSEDRARLLFECAPEAYYLCDLSGRLLDCNRAAETLVGYPREELKGRPVFALLPEAERERVASLLLQNSQGEHAGPVDLTPRRKDGRVIELEVRTYPVAFQGQVVVLAIARNVSEQRAATAALRHSEERFRSVWEQSHEGMRLTDRAGIVVAVNEAYCHLVRLPREKLVGHPFSVTYFGQGPDEGMEVYTRRFDTFTMVSRFTTTAKLWTGETVGLDISNSFLDIDGQRLVLTIFRDVTSLQRAQTNAAALSRLGQQLSAVKEVREAARIILETAGVILGWDACNVSLYEAATRRCRAVLSIETGAEGRVEQPAGAGFEPVSPLMLAVVEHGARLILKPPARVAAGAALFGACDRPCVSIAMVPMHDGESVIGVLSIYKFQENGYDRSSLGSLQAMADLCGGALNRIRAQEALAGSEAELRALFAAMTDLVLVLDRDGKYLQVAPTNVNSISRPDGGLVGRTVQEVLPPAVTGQIMRCIHEAIDSRQRMQIDYVLEVDGAPTWFEGNVSPLGRDRVFWIARNITDRKHLEEQVRQSQKMEAIGQLAGGVAHDFNNLLAVIRGNADLALLGLGSGIQINPRECLEQITAAVDRAANLTRQLLVFGRKQGMQPRPLSINDALLEVTRMLNRLIGEHIELKCELGASLPLIKADAGMLEQVVVNLAVNARDAMPRGGVLTIATSVERIEPGRTEHSPEARAGRFIRLRIQDSGAGIAPEHLARIFEPFFTTKSVGKGTGLGLATVYGILKQHQGWVEVHSELQIGSRFDVFFPAAEGNLTPDAPPADAPSPNHGTETILLVEDEPSVRMVSRRVLEGSGYKVLEAASGPEALALHAASSQKIHLLLTDIVMPGGISGLELSQQLRACDPALKVLTTSGYSSELADKDTTFFHRSHQRFLQKPCSAGALLAAVRSLLDEK